MRAVRETGPGPELTESLPVLAYLDRRGIDLTPRVRQVVDRAAAFRREIVEPHALVVDRQVARDPEHVAHHLIEAAARRGWFGLVVPRVFGGEGLPLGALVFGLEELAAGCLGITNLVAVHGLALCTIASVGALDGMERACRAIVEGERRGRPALLSTALTEPSAGTDIEDLALLRGARIGSEATPAPGGYRLSGRKVFISNGSIAAYHVVFMPTDRARPAETLTTFLVPADAPGVSVTRVEHKMGQRACPAAELLFDDCFVPDADRLGPVTGKTLELVLGATRGGVGAFGAGVARGAYERALRWASGHDLRGRPALSHQWVRFRLVHMRRNVMIARAAYLDAMLSNELFGLAGAIAGGRIERLLEHVPRGVAERLPLTRLPGAGESLRERLDALPEREVGLASAYGSHAKVTGSDLGMENCQIALDLLGADGLREESGVEKLFRDAKLLQIYEGTNQLNRLELYKHLVAEEG